MTPDEEAFVNSYTAVRKIEQEIDRHRTRLNMAIKFKDKKMTEAMEARNKIVGNDGSAEGEMREKILSLCAEADRRLKNGNQQ